MDTFKEKLSAYYNKFNEDKRLLSRHGRVEFVTSMQYIMKYLEALCDEKGATPSQIKVLDVGAGTGRYSIALAKEGYEPAFGARPLKRVIRQMIENPLAKLILEGKFYRMYLHTNMGYQDPNF